MSSALILGDLGSGLTTFVGLLYTAQIRYGTESEDTFRFSADRETIRRLEAVYGELGAGRFPVAEVNWEEHPASFVLAFRSGRLAGLSRSSDSHDGFDTVRVQVGGIAAQEVAELAHHDAVLEVATRRLFGSRLLLVLVDASRLVDAPEDSRAQLLDRYDRHLATAISVVARYRAALPRRRDRALEVMFVVTKVDRLAPEALAAIGSPPGRDGGRWEEARSTWGGRLVERYLPQVHALLSGRGSALGVRVLPQRWFLSGLTTEEVSGRPRIARRSLAPQGGWEPEYPFEEYRDLIEALATAAHRSSGDDPDE